MIYLLFLEWGITWETRLFAAEVRAGNAVDLVEPGSCVTEVQNVYNPSPT